MEIEQRKYIFEPTALENQIESENTVNKELRYEQILNILTKPMTAKQIAVEMKNRGYTPTDERNFAAPRLTELQNMGKIEIFGTTTCEYTGKKVSLYIKTGEFVPKEKYNLLYEKYENIKNIEQFSQTKIREQNKEIMNLKKYIRKLESEVNKA